MAELRLHLGAHKTATTHFQNSLEASGAALLRAGVRHVPLSRCRNTYSRVIKACIRGRITPEEARQRFQTFFAEDAEGVETVLVSDENILGQFEGMLSTGVLYPEAGRYMALVAKVFAGIRRRCYLTVRPYDRFFSSLYCEALRWEKQADFEGLKANILARASWQDLISRISAPLGGAPHVYRFEEYVRAPLAVLSDFSGLPPGALTQETRRDLRSSMSRDAVLAIRAGAPFIGSTAAYRRYVREIETALPAGADRPGFAPWTAGETRQLEESYAAFVSAC